MSPVSNGMSIALDALKDQISQATERLKRIPGGEGAEVCTLNCPVSRVRHYLCFQEGEIMFSQYKPGDDPSHEDTCCFDLAIMDLPVAIRVEAALRIPELIDNAFAREDEVLGYVEEATLKIKDHLNSV